MILSYWRGRHVPRLVRAIETVRAAARHAALLRQLLGRGQAERAEAAAGRKKRPRIPGRNSPIFPLMAKSVFWRARKIPAAQRTCCRSARWARRGRIPRPNRLMRMGSGARYCGASSSGGASATGSARGARRTSGSSPGSSTRSRTRPRARHGARQRVFIRGVLAGITDGRPQLGDRAARDRLDHPACAQAGRRRRAATWRSSGASSTGRRSTWSARSTRTSPARPARAANRRGPRPGAAVARGRARAGRSRASTSPG